MFSITHNGITLIALVITIIVMLILVAVSISLAINGGLFSYAGRAAHDTELAKQDELKLAEGQIEVDGKIYGSFNDYINGKEYIPVYSNDLLNNGVLTKTAEYTDTNEDTAIIPAGFGIVEDCEIINLGLVISDEFDSNGNSIGNEFVWIPVNVTTTEFENIRINRNNISEPDKNSETEYNEMRESVIENKGFYIARYEAGYLTGRTESSTSIATKPLSKKGVYPYNFVNWTDAVSASRSMYADNTKYGVTSTLCYGVQWDAMLNFLGKTSEIDSTAWGNYMNAGTFDFEGEYYTIGDDKWKNDKTKKYIDESMLLQTGVAERNSSKNIYDVAGNLWEWTMEQATMSSYPCSRGGWFDDYGSDYTVDSLNFFIPTKANSTIRI